MKTFANLLSLGLPKLSVQLGYEDQLINVKIKRNWAKALKVHSAYSGERT
jgi:hypothetical protein